MSPSERVLAGFALAATIAKDPGARAARPGLADAVADTLTQTARDLSQLGKAERRARIRTLTEPTTHSALAKPELGHRRALALLAHARAFTHMPDWLRELPLPRPGYAADPLLLSLLARIAARSQKAVE
jgi:hypothetical protein